MADYLASIFGTEKDKVNCSFYFKIGACRHGEKCSKVHNKPTFSQTVLLKNLYLNPLNSSQTADKSYLNSMTEEDLQRHFDEVFEELFVELESQYGEIEEMNICDNLSEHLAGNTYVKFRFEEDADKACRELNNRWFNSKPIYAELSPVTDFHEACCRQYQMGECPRGGFCNFMHLKPISQSLRRKLYSARYSKRRLVSRSPPPDRSGFYANNNPNIGYGNGYGNYGGGGGGFGGGGAQYDDFEQQQQQQQQYQQRPYSRSRSRSKSPSKRRKRSGRH